jgi:hypothetical protein
MPKFVNEQDIIDMLIDHISNEQPHIIALDCPEINEMLFVEAETIVNTHNQNLVTTATIQNSANRIIVKAEKLCQ